MNLWDLGVILLVLGVMVGWTWRSIRRCLRGFSRRLASLDSTLRALNQQVWLSTQQLEAIESLQQHPPPYTLREKIRRLVAKVFT